jgi:hypothetical protein
MSPTLKVKEKHWGNMEGDNRLNGTVVGQRYGQACNQQPACGSGVVHVKAFAGIRAGVRLRMMIGYEGEGGGGGEYKEECLFNNDCDKDK